MKYFNYIWICCCFSSTVFSQPAFTNIDTLLTRNFEAVNLRNVAAYHSLLNTPVIFKSKLSKTKADSVVVLKPFTEAFAEMIRELTDFAGSDDIEVRYENYEPMNTKEYNSKVRGKIIVHVNLVINNTFTVKVPFVIMAYNGTYAIEQPMMVMFAE